uniref:Permethrin resistance-associated opsin n=1 Tax=Culex pipiens pallens TaxID=42434 RepID=C4PD33_CULPA|nr:permethrin resistance-associated opsin [Culex pipiens pallens]
MASYAAWTAVKAGVGAAMNLTVVDKVPADMLHMVDAHWYQFPPMNPLWHAMLGWAIFFLCLISLIGNGMVINIFTSTKTLKTPSNLLVVNLAFSDFLMMFTMGPPMVMNCYYETWVFGPFACEVYAMCGSLFGCASIWTMTLIAFDRYNVIVKGLAAKPMTNSGAMIKILGVWAFSLFWTLAPFFGWNRYVPEGNMTACGTDYLTQTWLSRSYILIYAIFVYWLPLLTIIYSYTFILKAVSAHEESMREQAKKMNVASLRSSESQQQSAEIKLAKVALVTISLWFMAWTPYLVINFTGFLKAAPNHPAGHHLGLAVRQGQRRLQPDRVRYQPSEVPRGPVPDGTRRFRASRTTTTPTTGSRLLPQPLPLRTRRPKFNGEESQD